MSTYICKSCNKRNTILPEWQHSDEPVIIIKCKFCGNKARYSPKKNSAAEKKEIQPGTRIVGLSKSSSERNSGTKIKLEVVSGSEGQNSYEIVQKNLSYTIFLGRNPKSKCMMIAKPEDDFFIVDDPFVSRLHSCIQILLKNNNVRITIEDKGSANGTFLNSSNLAQGDIAILNEGDIIQLGDTKFRIQIT